MAQTGASDVKKLLDAEAGVFDRMKGRPPEGGQESAPGPRAQYRSLKKFGADNKIETSTPNPAALPQVPREPAGAATRSLQSRTVVIPEAAPGAEAPGVTEVHRFDYELGRSFTTVIDSATGKALSIEESAETVAPLSSLERARALSLARAANGEIDKIVTEAGEGKYHVVALLNSGAGKGSRKILLWVERPKISPRVVVDLVAGSVAAR